MLHIESRDLRRVFLSALTQPSGWSSWRLDCMIYWLKVLEDAKNLIFTIFLIMPGKALRLIRADMHDDRGLNNAISVVTC